MSDKATRFDIAAGVLSAAVLAVAVVLGLFLQSWGNELDALLDRAAAQSPKDSREADRMALQQWNSLVESVRGELRSTAKELDADRAVIADMRPANPGGTAVTPENPRVSRADLPAVIARETGTIRREAEVKEARRLSAAMVAGAVHTAELLAPSLGLSADQVTKMQGILTEEGEACRRLLESPDRGADYQAQAGAIIARTEERIRPVLNESQVKAYERARADWWGPGLNYARPGKPKPEKK
ncbi:MAG: hypothetical protein K8T20_08525 [Planctomycetes bacterium]|nr:hypothetical protein [Planctomycetota bacterium]